MGRPPPLAAQAPDLSPDEAARERVVSRTASSHLGTREPGPRSEFRSAFPCNRQPIAPESNGLKVGYRAVGRGVIVSAAKDRFLCEMLTFAWTSPGVKRPRVEHGAGEKFLDQMFRGSLGTREKTKSCRPLSFDGRPARLKDFSSFPVSRESIA